jgi:hypothetical protein
MKYTYSRNKTLKKLKESNLVSTKAFILIENTLLAKQDKPVEATIPVIKANYKTGEIKELNIPVYQPTNHLDKLVLPEKIDVQDPIYMSNAGLLLLVYKFNSLLDFNKQLLISLKEIQK